MSALSFSEGKVDVKKLAPSYILDDTCSPVLFQRHDTTLTFIHVTVKDYLQTDASPILITETDAMHCHSMTATACLLSGLQVFASDYDHQTKLLRLVKGLHGLHVYATEYWTEYLLSVVTGDSTPPSTVVELAARLANTLELHCASEGTIEMQDTRLENLSSHPILLKHVSWALHARSQKRLDQEIMKRSETSSAIKPDGVSLMLENYQNTIEEIMDMQSLPGVSSEELDVFKSHFRSSAYTCRLRTCPRATLGFETAILREKHELNHTTGFRCSVTGCQFPPSTSTQALKAHVAKHHTQKLEWKPIRRKKGQEFRKVTSTRLDRSVTTFRQSDTTQSILRRDENIGVSSANIPVTNSPVSGSRVNIQHTTPPLKLKDTHKRSRSPGSSYSQPSNLQPSNIQLTELQDRQLEEELGPFMDHFKDVTALCMHEVEGQLGMETPWKKFRPMLTDPILTLSERYIAYAEPQIRTRYQYQVEGWNNRWKEQLDYMGIEPLLVKVWSRVFCYTTTTTEHPDSLCYYLQMYEEYRDDQLTDQSKDEVARFLAWMESQSKAISFAAPSTELVKTHKDKLPLDSNGTQTEKLPKSACHVCHKVYMDVELQRHLQTCHGETLNDPHQAVTWNVENPKKEYQQLESMETPSRGPQIDVQNLPLPSAREIWDALQPNGLSVSDLKARFNYRFNYRFIALVLEVASLDVHNDATGWFTTHSKTPPDEEPTKEDTRQSGDSRSQPEGSRAETEAHGDQFTRDDVITGHSATDWEKFLEGTSLLNKPVSPPSFSDILIEGQAVSASMKFYQDPRDEPWNEPNAAQREAMRQHSAKVSFSHS